MAEGETISEKIADIVESKEALREAIVGKGATLDAGSKIETFSSAIDGIQVYSHSGDTIEIDRTTVVDLIIPDGVSIIRRGAFSTCRKIKTIQIPASVMTIEEWSLPWRLIGVVEGPFEIFIEKTVDEVRKMTPSYTSWCRPGGDDSATVTIHCTDGDLTVE